MNCLPAEGQDDTEDFNAPLVWAAEGCNQLCHPLLLPARQFAFALWRMDLESQ